MDITLDLAPIKLRVVVDQISRIGITELFVNAGFCEFVVERVEFAREVAPLVRSGENWLPSA